MSKSKDNDQGQVFTNNWSEGVTFTPTPTKAVIESKMAIMRDGAELYTIIIKPQGEGQFPVVLAISPYSAPYAIPTTFENYTSLNPILGANDYMAFVAAGYCVLFQHCRGTGNSTGEFQYALNECDDACDTLDWIRAQDFYNGEIFRFGGSYLGLTALIDAHKHHKDVKGIVALVPNTWPYETANKNGFFKTGLLGEWEYQQMSMYGHDGPLKVNYTPDVFRTFPQKDWGKLIFGKTDPLYNVNQNHPNENDPFWRSEEAPGYTMYSAFEQLETPTLFTTGWFDLFVDPMVKIWNDIIPEETRKKSAFLISPYAHAFDNPRWNPWPYEMNGSTVDEYSPNMYLNWFNHIRTGEPLEFVKEGRINFFPECGQKKWYFEKMFTKGINEHTLYLNENGKLETNQGESSETTYLYNPFNPVVYYGGTCQTNAGLAVRPGYEHLGAGNPFMPQDEPNWRYDVISFVAEPFKEKTILKGGMDIELYVKSDCEDTCFYVRLHLVRDGVTYGIRDDITSLCYQLDDYTPGEEVKLHFELAPLAWEFQAGDQLRIDVTSSCFPHYSLHTNVKGLQAEIDKPKYANNTVVLGKSKFNYYTDNLSEEKYEIIEVKSK